MAQRMVSARELVGRRIVAFRAGAFQNGPRRARRGVAHDPEIVLDDGSVLYFVTEELESASGYGVFVGRRKARRR